MAIVVVADDDAVMTDFIRYSLEVAGHTVYAALDGPTALQFIAEHPPDLVVVDQAMPGMTGLEVVAALRSQPANAHVRILMISAYGPVDSGGLVDKFVAKPLRPRELASVLRELFGPQNRSEE
jgi:CheY-like chemotaxis protein